MDTLLQLCTNGQEWSGHFNAAESRWVSDSPLTRGKELWAWRMPCGARLSRAGCRCWWHRLQRALAKQGTAVDVWKPAWSTSRTEVQRSQSPSCTAAQFSTAHFHLDNALMFALASMNRQNYHLTTAQGHCCSALCWQLRLCCSMAFAMRKSEKDPIIQLQVCAVSSCSVQNGRGTP